MSDEGRGRNDASLKALARTRELDRSNPAKTRADRDERVNAIIGLMASGEWQGVKSHRDLAARWGVSMHAVYDYAREASSVVRLCVMGDPKAIMAACLSGIEECRRRALARTKWVRVSTDEYREVEDPNVEAALRAYELQMRALGLFHEQQVGESSWNSLPIDEKRRRLEEAKARIAAEETKLLGEGEKKEGLQ